MYLNASFGWHRPRFKWGMSYILKYFLHRLKICQWDVEQWYNHPSFHHLVSSRHLSCSVLNVLVHSSTTAAHLRTVPHLYYPTSFHVIKAKRPKSWPSTWTRTCLPVWSSCSTWRVVSSVQEQPCPSSWKRRLQAHISVTSLQSAQIRKPFCSKNRTVQH